MTLALRELHAMSRLEADQEQVQKAHVWAAALSKDVWSATTICHEDSRTWSEAEDQGQPVPHQPIPEGWDCLADFLEHGSTCGKCCFVLIGEMGLPPDHAIEYLRGDLEAWRQAAVTGSEGEQ